MSVTSSEHITCAEQCAAMQHIAREQFAEVDDLTVGIILQTLGDIDVRRALVKVAASPLADLVHTAAVAFVMSVAEERRKVIEAAEAEHADA